MRQREKSGGKTRRGARNQKAGFLRVRCVSGGGVVNTEHSLTRWEIQGHDRQLGRESECFESKLENKLEINRMLISMSMPHGPDLFFDCEIPHDVNLVSGPELGVAGQMQ